MAVPPEAAGQAALRTGLDSAQAQARRDPRDNVVIRFAGDSGDGMQLAGMQFTTESALAGNDIATLPDFPAEIRAPAGTLAGVSGFQLNFSSSEVFTAGRRADGAGRDEPCGAEGQYRRPSAQRRANRRQGSVYRRQSQEGGLHLQSADRPLARQVSGLPARSHQVDDFRACTILGLNNRAVFRCRNLFVLGMLSWLYPAPDRVHDRIHREQVQEDPRLSKRPICGRSRRALTSARPRRCSPAPTK